MNSFYGVLGTPACRFYNPALANSITGMGKEMLLWSKRWFEAAGFDVLYGDTDSLFVQSATTIRTRAQRAGRELAAALNADLARVHRRALARAEPARARSSRSSTCKLFLPRARHSTRGASKRYAGVAHGATARRGRVRRHGSRAPRLDRAREARAARAVSAAVHGPARRRVSRGRRAARARRRARRRARLSQEPAQGRGRIHGDDAAARRGGAQVDAAAGPARSATS